MPTRTNSPSTAGKSRKDELLNENFVDEEHLQAFASALSINDTLHLEGEASPLSPRSPPAPLDSPVASNSASRLRPQTWKYGPDNGSFGSGGSGERVEKLTATSDFAPIHQRVSKRRPRTSNQGLTYHLIRWPLLGFFFTIIYFEFLTYVITRQVVNVFEWLVAWRGPKVKLRRALRNSKTYEEWIAAAKDMDSNLGFDDWKETDEDSYFDYTLVKRVKRTLTRLRAAGDARGLMDALAICVRSNFAGTESVKMYSETFFGTKRLIEEHVKEVATCLDFVRTAKDVSLDEKRAFFRAINKHYGASALCLSGGASFGYYHFGVVKAFLDADLLPRVITGTSAGGLIAALLCTRTNDELKELLVPELADKITACEDPFHVWFKRFRQTGARFDTVTWAKKSMWFTRGSMTFKEAYERTGRALNISVVPSDRHSPTILLNHLTAPNCLIWSANLASAAVPGILNPVVLMAKDRDGNVKPHNLGGSRFKDGSLREDIPLGSLHTQFNCNFSIVSQTNPHIHLFFFAPRGSVGRPVAHRKGKGWRGGFILSALESYIKLDLSKHFKVIRDLDLMPQILQSDWSGVFLQRFSGDLTLTPRTTIRDWFRILSDPDRNQLEHMLTVGQRVTWPALRMVKNRMTIERAILKGRTEIRSAIHRDRTSNDVTSPPKSSSGLRIPEVVPLESDVDAGFASRTRRNKGSRGIGGLGITTTFEPELGYGLGLSPSQTQTTRRRKNNSRRRRASEVFALDSDEVEEDDLLLPSNRQITASRSVPPEIPGSSPAKRGYSINLGDTLRHVRAPSLSALSSPFRSIRQASVSPQNEEPPSLLSQQGQNQNPRVKSQLSITRWFGGASDSSSEEGSGEDEYNWRKSQGGARSATDEDTEEDLIMGEAEEEHGVEPIPGGEKVTQSDIDESMSAGQSGRSTREDTVISNSSENGGDAQGTVGEVVDVVARHELGNTPPQQDGAGH
ncbi:uncharacterized protein I303_108336 [Kwoniella dejecticola CBS 10117]|uniref:Patatin-like phospholipase domain-containing protein n=1 Tax=Kwoniella dejecticola CBS 10117 TaxID=1296121 RepID=A0A1A5ZXN5_9TREE|nr:patatin-like phospholipase domain-containing protein [Kwoniella dejecticola CBS 10117]OBR82576.1 patatin-like phospholipase domain-containing protein [Kwoniella dejecticola CBS 10117]